MKVETLDLTAAGGSYSAHDHAEDCGLAVLPLEGARCTCGVDLVAKVADQPIARRRRRRVESAPDQEVQGPGAAEEVP